MLRILNMLICLSSLSTNLLSYILVIRNVKGYNKKMRDGISASSYINYVGSRSIKDLFILLESKYLKVNMFEQYKCRLILLNGLKHIHKLFIVNLDNHQN